MKEKVSSRFNAAVATVVGLVVLTMIFTLQWTRRKIGTTVELVFIIANFDLA